MYALGRSGSRRAINIWPGFVDGLASLLLVVIFVLMVFMVAQYFLAAALTGKDAALERLHQEISNLADLLALERSANADLRINVAELSAGLQSSLANQESLANQLAALTEDRDALTARLAASEAETKKARKELEDAFKVIEAGKAKIEAKLAELAMLQQLRDQLRNKLDTTETKLSDVSKELEDAYKVIEADKAKIEARLAELAIMKQLRDELAAKLATADSDRQKQEKLTEEAQAAVTLLNRQIAALRQQLARISVALEVSEAKSQAQDVQIADLGKRLNVALASKVQELARYRSEFFGRLREVLGDRKDIRIVGDRFVFQSEVLFDTGSADLAESGKIQIAQLAKSLKEIAKSIPKDIDWLLRVDGHTDRRPIHTPEFQSNWELSTARAISVVKFLASQGIPESHMAATGFAEFRPIDNGQDEIAFRRNRRIEFKLTQQ